MDQLGQILDQGADVNAVDQACFASMCSDLILVLNVPSFFLFRSQDGYSALILSACFGNFKAMQLLLTYGANIDYVSKVCEQARASPFLAGACRGRAKLCLGLHVLVVLTTSALNTVLLYAYCKKGWMHGACGCCARRECANREVCFVFLRNGQGDRFTGLARKRSNLS